jgi:dTDP-4-amino-4,6-dideoxygalactose transaminase
MWEEACASFGVPLIIDSAAGFGAETEDGSRIGGRGSAEVFSFHATKPFAVGEGGVVICRDPALVDTVRRLVNFGFDEDHGVSVPGLNAKMSEIHAATALAVLDGYDDVLAARRELAGQMSSELVNRGFTVQRGCEGSTFQFVPVLAPSAARRDEILRIAPEARIEVRSYFDVPLHKLSAFRQAECGKLTVTEELATRTLSLPMANDLSEQNIGRILDLCDKATC